MSHNLESSPGCISAALAILGDKWTALIIRDLTAHAQTFSELEQSLSGISPRTLSQRLDKLESEHIIYRKQYCEHPPRFKYELTPKGQDLEGILRQMAEWGEHYSHPRQTA